jgi:hypothetical protein
VRARRRSSRGPRGVWLVVFVRRSGGSGSNGVSRRSSGSEGDDCRSQTNATVWVGVKREDFCAVFWQIGERGESAPAKESPSTGRQSSTLGKLAACSPLLQPSTRYDFRQLRPRRSSFIMILSFIRRHATLHRLEYCQRVCHGRHSVDATPFTPLWTKLDGKGERSWGRNRC